MGLVEGTLIGVIQGQFGSGRRHFDWCHTGPDWVK